MQFKTAFKDFLQSISDHNWEVTKKYLDPNLPINILLPNQRPIKTYDDFVNSQKIYFESKTSSFEYQIIQIEESENLGFGVTHNKVKLDSSNNEPIELQICFLFKKVSEDWKLIFDQNSFLKL